MTCTLLDVPHDVQCHILAFLGVRSLLNAACSCKALHAIACGLPLHPVMTSRTRMRRWLLRPDISRRVVSLTVRSRETFPSNLLSLGSLKTLVVSFGWLGAQLLKTLPTTLEHLDLHRLAYHDGDVFLTRSLSRLVNLHTLKLTFMPSWDTVVVDGIDMLPLRRLSIRGAPVVVIRTPLAIEKVHLQAVDAIICPHEIHSHELHIECTNGIVAYDIMLTELSCQNVRTVSLCSPHRITVPALQHMHKLEHLHVRFDSVLLPLHYLECKPNVRSVLLETRYGVALAGRHSKLAPHVDVKVSVAGIPLDRNAIRKMFFGI